MLIAAFLYLQVPNGNEGKEFSFKFNGALTYYILYTHYYLCTRSIHYIHDTYKTLNILFMFCSITAYMVVVLLALVPSQSNSHHVKTQLLRPYFSFENI